MREQTLIDLSHPLRTGMPVFPQDPEVVLEPTSALAPWRVTRLGLGTHSGTHIDAASHFVPGGTTIDRYPLERFVLPALVAPVAGGRRRGQAIEWSLSRRVLPGELRRPRRPPAHRLGPRTGGLCRGAQPPVPGRGGGAGAGRSRRSPRRHGRAQRRRDGGAAPRTPTPTLLGADVLIVENLTGLDALTPGRPYTLRLRAAAARRRRRLTHPRLRVRRRRLTGPVHVVPQGAPLT